MSIIGPETNFSWTSKPIGCEHDALVFNFARAVALKRDG